VRRLGLKIQGIRNMYLKLLKAEKIPDPGWDLIPNVLKELHHQGT